uniref:Uncharacterized protein n=1 Tax=Aegilops tauschii subsp. strangulata TaxID=200361 RepID=A0A453HX79_AEGTS
ERRKDRKDKDREKRRGRCSGGHERATGTITAGSSSYTSRWRKRRGRCGGGRERVTARSSAGSWSFTRRWGRDSSVQPSRPQDAEEILEGIKITRTLPF